MPGSCRMSGLADYYRGLSAVIRYQGFDPDQLIRVFITPDRGVRNEKGADSSEMNLPPPSGAAANQSSPPLELILLSWHRTQLIAVPLATNTRRASWPLIMTFVQPGALSSLHIRVRLAAVRESTVPSPLTP
jgi:hypothetical protein